MLNKEILDEIINQDYPSIVKTIEQFLVSQVEDNNLNGIIFGMSGGIDSAVLAYLAKRVLKEKTLALIMPDTSITPKIETEDALKMIDKLGLEYKMLDIKPIVNEYAKYLEPNDLAQGNLRARVRTNILYYYANAKKLLVLGSSDKSEHLIGYFTKYGDGASDALPIVSLYKLQIRKLAEYLEIPTNVIEKKSSPHLWKYHDAEQEIGASYEVIDSVLYCMYDKKLSIEQTIEKTGIEREMVEKIDSLFVKSRHKRLSQSRPFRLR